MRWPAVSYGALPVIIFLLIAIGSLVGYALTTANVESSRSRSIDRRFRENSTQVDGVFDSYAYLLDGSTGDLQSGTVDEASWDKFIDVFHLSNNFSGMEAIGVANGNSPQAARIAFVTPRTDLTSKAVGTSLAIEQSITTAMSDAGKFGEVKLSGSLPNIFSTKKADPNTKPGFLLVSPYYDTSLPLSSSDEKTQALRGYSVAMFRGDIFFSSVFKDIDLTHTDLRVYLGDEKPENLQYQMNQTTDSDQRRAVQKIDEFGKTFTLVYSFDTASIVPFSINYLPQFLLIGGLGVSLLVAGISGYLLRSRYRKLVFQKEQDVNFAKDELLSLASHQLRTPATGVKQYLGMVLQGFAGDLTSQQRTYLERAYNSNNRQLHVINDILHLAKLEAGRIVLAEHKFDIADMVREVVDEQREEANKGEIKLELQSPPRGMIVGDSHMLRMVAENLVSNAIKYTPPKGKVSVRLHRRAKSWVLVIKDTGVGIADKDLNKLFKQFSRISNARSDFVTGTGIGLYLAHHLVVLHGGTIGVSSSENKGSTFTVRLPRKM
ncbi:MAG: putative histidine kinase [Candidatus Saccharibacteria bacterium]|nr:putative histidine kinase [Candidatus Saccharibacteria bacterium]